MELNSLIAECTAYDFKVMLEEKKPKSWLKSVSAFANGLGGSLFFGIDNDGIVCFAPEFFDLQMLLQPLEEELYLPPVLIEVGNLKRGQMKGIGEERELTSLLPIIELDQSELLFVLL